MKKVLTFLAVAALLAVSCNKEQKELGAPNTRLTFTVNADQLATRAVSGTHGTANRLQVGVYLKSGATFSHIAALQKTMTEVTFPATVSLDLARNETYKIVFWADDASADAYLVDWSENMTVSEKVDGPYEGNKANRDAFYKMVDVTPTGSASQAVTLVRPFAQVNVGTNDLDKFKAAAVYNGDIQTKVVISGVASGMNLLDGTATDGTKDMTFNYAASLEPTLVSSEANYSYLALNYILCPADATVTANISIRKADAEDNINAFTVSNMPVKPNYRTNVVGKLLTGTVVYTVDVDTDFINDLDKKVAPTFASVDDLNTYFATMANNADNGDINPEEVTLTAIADGETITLPAIAGDVVIRILATLPTGTLNIAYASSGSKPENLSLYVEKLKKLVANIPATHFTLLSGSYITDSAEVQTSSTTFVIQKGARVGTAVIKQGNAEIAGEVAKVEVDSDATADGAGAAVQVFLSKESAVDQIVLDAPTDVVVEQPKDQIENGDTEYKVEVLVNKDGCTATAQNGGQIYVRVAAGVTCSVAADGKSEAEAGQDSVPSGVTIASVGDGSSVDTYEDEAGKIVVKDDVNEEQINEKNFQAKIGDQHFMTVLEAFEAAKAGDEVVILVEAFDKIEAGSFAIDPSAALSVDYEAIYDSATQLWNVVLASWKGNIASDEQFAAATNGKEISISTPALLAKLAENVTSGNDYAGYTITLESDIDLNNTEWTPIGENGKNFAGEFDGGGHTVSNLKISRGYADEDLNWRVGFIGSAIGAKVHHLTIHNANVRARGEVAAAVGYNAYSVEGKPSEIYNVNVTGHVVISAAHRGAAAICGYSNYYVHECIVNVDETSIIDGYWASGGIVGFSPQSGDIKNNYSNIKVVSNYACGGIVGLIEDSVEISGNTVENTSLQASTDYGIGGIIGMMNYGTGLKIKNNTVSNVTIDATENVAGVIGAVWADYGTGAVEITNNTITGITINSSKGDGTAAFIGYIESGRTATISGNSIQGTINTAKALVNDGIWAGVTDASNVVASNNTMNLEINVAE